MAIIIQARVGATRFPSKMTVPFYDGQGILYYLLRRIKKANFHIPIILAIPDSAENDILEDIGYALGISSIYRGSEDDVLQRFIRAAEAFGVNDIIRVCADNPFLDISSLQLLITQIQKQDADYTCFTLSNSTPSIKSHFGFWAEAVRLKTLKEIAKRTDENVYREHVTNYIYTHPTLFHIEKLPVEPEIESNSWARFTVDTKTDFENMSHLASLLPAYPIVATNTLLSLARKNDIIKSAMQAEIEKNKK